MLSIKNTQNRIKNLVKLWKMAFPEEWDLTVEAVKLNRSMQDNKFGELTHAKDSKLIERALYEIPETMFMAFVKELDDEEMTYLKTKEGGRWFAKAHPMFSLTIV